MSVKYFITGTDTEVGKTYISQGLLRFYRAKGLKVIGVKPIASGASYIDGVLKNEDALCLQRESSVTLPYEMINPFVYEPAIAPHVAAAKENRCIRSEELITACSPALTHSCDLHIVEGAGGWLTPLNPDENMLQFIKHYQMKIILVVGLRLGCINHAMLTWRVMREENFPVIGWVANYIDASYEASDVIATLRQSLPVPCLGIIAHGQAPEKVFQDFFSVVSPEDRIMI